ncbi:SCY1-like protein 2, partial [Parelaphostrongylus tenuis]
VVSVWIFDKKDIDRWPKDDRESFLSLIRQGVSQLTKLRHPRLLVVEHPIEESRLVPRFLAFATEPVFACLANCLCRPEHVSASSSSAVSTHLNNVKFSEVEIKHGLFQFAYETFNWDIHLPAISQPNLDYLAPEYVVGGGCDSHTDIYSLGVLSYAVFNECRPPFEHKNDLDRFKRNMEKLNNFQGRIELIPPVLLNDLKMC